MREGRFSKLAKELPPWGLSFVINFTILLMFHFVIMEQVVPAISGSITTELSEPVDIEERELNFSEDITQEQVGNEGTLASFTPTLKAARIVGENDAPLQERIEQVLNPEMPRLAEASLVQLQGDIAQTIEVKGHSDDAKGGIEGAMDRMAYEIRQSLRDRKTLVVWLFDASGSLNERRSQIADRFENIYRQLEKTGSVDGLYSVVASYGQNHKLLTPTPTQEIDELRAAVRTRIVVDETGIENVFTAVQAALEQYRGFRRDEGPWNKMIVIVTDERGDDYEPLLENVISQARRSQTRVFTIGNSSVLGRNEGWVRYVYPDGFEDYLPVDQGPEVAFPDAIQLPFIGSGDDWRLREMSASYGPYALSRLCAETGGLFLITEESRGYTFDRAVMRQYAPDYRPVAEVFSEISRNPAKSALVNAARLTYDSNLPRPYTRFRAFDDNVLREDLTNAQRPVAEVDFALQRLYSILSTGESARDSLTEPRWQAAFDLAIGRVLAMRVRYFGYNQQLAAMKVSPRPFQNKDNNAWQLVTSDEIDSGPETRKAAENAKKYLNRVIEQHPDTPWALLAKQELSSDLGWSWRESWMQPPPAPGSEEERAMLLLAEEQRQRAREQAERPRVPPKL